MDIFGYLTKIDNTFLICDRFWICFGTFLPHLQKSPGLMTLLNVATAVLGRETRETRVIWVTCDSWNGCHLDDLAHRLRAAKIRLRGWDMPFFIVVELGTDLEQTDCSIFNTCFWLLPPCLCLEVELRYTCLGQNWPVRPVTKAAVAITNAAV